MQPRRLTPIALAAFATAMLAAPSSAKADRELQQFLFRGSEYAGKHLFVSNPQGGPLYDYNQFSQRLEYNRDGAGYTWESYRFFGPDSYGNTNTVDLGPLKVELGLDPAVLASGQPIGIHSRVGFTTRLIPEVFFDAQTGQRDYNQFSGVSNFSPAPIAYTVTLNTGVQDFEWSGNVLVDSSGRLNALGFYDIEVRFTNVASYTADGVLVHDEQVTDFDLGPIDLSGNIAFDMVAGLMQSIGATVSAVGPRVFSGAAQRDKVVDELLAKLEAGGALTGEEMQVLLQYAIESAYRSDPIGMALNGLPSELSLGDGLTLSVAQSEATTTDTPAHQTLLPAPGMLVLFGTMLGGLSSAGRWRRRLR